ncbi:hypothetical protein [Streptomyces sp. NWU339]|uniref:hypothetical protein n=1 Tax=Streptomyces sp. NWU339 TaxID=2185284 RepID=UPI0026CF90FC
MLLSPTPRGARLARLLATDWMRDRVRDRDLPHRVSEAAEHLVAELAANAATHGRLAGRDFRLALLDRGATLRIEVTGTRGDDLPRPSRPAPDAEHLAPGVAARLERDLSPTAVRKALADGLPLEPLVRPAAFLAHRLTVKLPPLPPFRAPEPPPPVRYPLRNCDTCDHAYRGPDPHHCQGCASAGVGSGVPDTGTDEPSLVEQGRP